MSGEMMNFPDTAEEFMEQYKIVDSEEVYTNGAELVPIFRMKQWFEQHPEPHWIPVTERLPEEDGDYLVTFEEGYAEDYGFDPIGFAPFEADCEGFGIWQECFDRHTLGSLGSDWVEIKVIAWMPLPEPYKGVTE